MAEGQDKKDHIKVDEKITVSESGSTRTEKKIIEKFAESPARILDETIEITKTVEKKFAGQAQVKKARDYWYTLGPGLTTGASDDDPSGIATYSQTGAGYGFKFLWLAWFTLPLMAVVQEMCARIGLVTGRGLAANIRRHFPKPVLIVCTIFLFLANTFNIGADLGAMEEAIRLFRPDWNYFYLIVLIAIIIMLLLIFTTYQKYAGYMKWLALTLFAYIFSTLMIKGLNWHEILSSAIRPSIGLSKDQILIITGALGTTISPYLFFWQTSQEIEQAVEKGLTNVSMRQDSLSDKDIKEMRIDVWSGMFLSNLVMFFIITACAATLNKAGITTIGTAADAADALRPLAGQYSYLLFAAGIIGTGALAIPVLAGSSSYAISESFGWKQGLHFKLRQAYAFYGIVMISLIVGVLLNLIGLDPIKALIYSAVGNALVAPIVLILIWILSSSDKIMGKHKNGSWTKIIGLIAILLMLVAGIATILSLIFK